jgi:cytochrome c nitrite reductase small subunit
MKQFFKIISFLYPPKRFKIPVIILLGTISGLGLYSFYVSRAWSYLSDEPETCINCHIMSPQYTTWRHSSHREVATCNDCHVPQDNIFRTYYFKGVDGMRHSAIFTTRGYKQTIKMLNPGNNVVQENCIRCHGHLTEMLEANITFNQAKSGKGKACWDCHRDVPHGRVKSLSVTPFTQVPVPGKPIPDFFEKLFNKK